MCIDGSLPWELLEIYETGECGELIPIPEFREHLTLEGLELLEDFGLDDWPLTIGHVQERLDKMLRDGDMDEYGRVY